MRTGNELGSGTGKMMVGPRCVGVGPDGFGGGTAFGGAGMTRGYRCGENRKKEWGKGLEGT